MPTTPRGLIDYPSEGDTDWYSTSDGLEEWLARAELIGLPTYDTFSDLPAAGSTKVVNPGTGQDQRQFAAVKGDSTIYRDNGTSWDAWMNYYTDSDAVNAVNSETSLSVDISGDADTLDGNDATAFASSGHSHAHSELTSVGTDDHHAKYTDSEAQTAINNDTDHGSTASHNYFSGSHTDLTNVGASDHHSKYTDTEAVSAVNAETSLSVDISGDADSVDGYQGADLAALGESETVTGAWTFDSELTVSGTSTTEDSGDGVIAVKPLAGTNLDGHFRFLDPDGSDAATFYYTNNNNNVVLYSYMTSQEYLSVPVGTTGGSPNFPQGVQKSGNEVLDNTQVTSTTNASGNYELTVQGDTYEFIPE